MTLIDCRKNFETYKGIMKEPYLVNGSMVYEVEFLGLNELYNFLLSNPIVNTIIFPKQVSQSNDERTMNFCKLTYEEALNYLNGGYEKNIEKLLELKRDLEVVKNFSSNKTKVIRSFTGSRVSINGFISNSPKKFYRLERLEEKKFIKINANLAFGMEDTADLVLHRGVLLKNLVDLLENNNYNVALNTFILLRREQELFYLKLHLKEINSSLFIEDIIFPLTSIAFLRRLVFRVMESVPFKEEWSKNYGIGLNDDEVKKILKLSSKDIFVGRPKRIGLKGISLKEDADTFLKYVKADKYIKVLKK